MCLGNTLYKLIRIWNFIFQQEHLLAWIHNIDIEIAAIGILLLDYMAGQMKRGTVGDFMPSYFDQTLKFVMLGIVSILGFVLKKLNCLILF